MSLLMKKKVKEKTNEVPIQITWKEIKRQKVLLFWSFLIVIYGVIFYYLPLTGWVMAFQNYKPKDGIFHSEFIGLAKFQQLFHDDTFIRVIRNTLAMGLINLVASFVMAIVFALVRSVLHKGALALHLVPQLGEEVVQRLLQGLEFAVAGVETH